MNKLFESYLVFVTFLNAGQLVLSVTAYVCQFSEEGVSVALA